MAEKVSAGKRGAGFRVFSLVACLWWLLGLSIAFYWTSLRDPFFPLDRLACLVWSSSGILILASVIAIQLRCRKIRPAALSVFMSALSRAAS